MIRYLGTGMLILAIVGVDVAAANLSFAVAAEAQVAESKAEREARRAADEALFGDQRARESEKRKIRDARKQAQKDLRLKKRQAERAARVAESAQRRAQRKARLKALIDK